MMLCLKNVYLETEEGVLADILVEDGHIATLSTAGELAIPPDAHVLDSSGLTAVPGFIDLQINGAFGADFTEDPTSIWAVAEKLPRYGVTAFLPTIISSPPHHYQRAFDALLYGRPGGFTGALPLGLHLEGPFLNPEKAGAHNPKLLRRPDLHMASTWLPKGGVRMVTLAPELPKALDLIRMLSNRGVLVALGHSLADYTRAQTAFSVGARYGTHLFNAMAPLEHRSPGLVGALLADPRPSFGVLVDGIHLHPSIVRLVWNEAPHRVSLVTDAMAGLGMPEGQYRLSNREVIVEGDTARLADGTLAGTLLSIDQALRNLIDFAGTSLSRALPSVTTLPARLLDLGPTFGRLSPGARADIVLLDDELQVHTTICAGELVFYNGVFTRESCPS